MRLISLTANQETFRPIHFNRAGITLILGKQKSHGQAERGKTYNGVGKSLAIALIHFCLGSNKNKEFEHALPEWEFCLDFEVAGQRLRARRNTSTANRIYLNDEEMGVEKFREHLEAKVFHLPNPRPELKFRSLISRFIRPRKASYVTFDSVEQKETPYGKLLRNSFLLGLDVDLVETKRNIIVARDKMRDFRTNLEKDTVFLEFFTGFKDVEIELIDLDENIERLERDIRSFKIAENYHQVEIEANDMRGELQRHRNRDVLIRNAVANIEHSLDDRQDVPINRVIEMYNEASTVIAEKAIKRVEEVVDFHRQLMARRVKRLSSERARLQTEQKDIKGQIDNINRQLNSKLQFLGEHGALEEYSKLTNIVADLKSKAGKLRDYKELLAKYSEQIREKNAALVSESDKSSKYLDQAVELTNGNLALFRTFSRRFYPDKPGGLTVSNNEGENQVRFDIHAKIQDDASDGINEVKIFCFDMTLLTARHNHNVEFLFHDSRLFSDIDHRQRAILFRIADEQSREREIQYIATVNEDQIISMKNQFTDSEYESIFTKNVVLELTDDSPTEKLLGIEVDMHYE